MAEPCEDESTAGVPALEEALRCLRAIALPCEPPVGVGSFDVLYAGAREVVVWYSPARPEHRSGEVAIPTARLAAAWGALVGGEALDEAALERLGNGAAGGRWLLALLAQIPGVRVRADSLTLEWSAPIPTAAEPTKRRVRKRAT
jgi:hypothetical protein